MADTERIYRSALEYANDYAHMADAAQHDVAEVREKFVSLSKMWSLVATAAAQDPHYYDTFDQPLATLRPVEDVQTDLL